MPLSQLIQMLIHKLEIGAGSRYLRILALVMGVIALAFLYDIRSYRNMAAPEAMDAAQLARNISEGKGYTTLFIRPFSLYLMQNHNQSGSSFALTNIVSDTAQIKRAHPDLANPPVYPVLLAGLMKVLPFDYTVNLKKAFWTNNGGFWRYQPDFLIALFNQILMLVVVVLTFFLAKNLFDSNVAWMSAILVLGSELIWRFSVSGLSTMMLLIIFLGMTLLMLEVERGARETAPHTGRLVGLAIAVGILAGLGALTRYAFGWGIIPIALFLMLFGGEKRFWCLMATLCAFSLVVTPWLVRNFIVSGTPFGTAGFAVVEATDAFPRFQLERSIHPDFSLATFLGQYFSKLTRGVHALLQGDILKNGATWAGVLFFAGLFLNFRSTGAQRIRYFLLMCLAVFIVTQSLGHTQLSDLTPDINSENLLVLLVPLVFVFGSSFFFTLLDQMTLPLPQLRYAIIAGFATLCCLPLFFTLWLRSIPVVYPPYFPPEIQQTANWMKPDELMMSDIPWAVAWYGNRQCLWLTRDAQTEFFAVNDYMKPIQALYLTPLTMDGKFVSEWVQARDFSWGGFIMDSVVNNKIPSGFPLHNSPKGFLPDRLFLTDRDRWKTAQ